MSVTFLERGKITDSAFELPSDIRTKRVMTFGTGLNVVSPRQWRVYLKVQRKNHRVLTKGEASVFGKIGHVTDARNTKHTDRARFDFDPGSTWLDDRFGGDDRRERSPSTDLVG